MSNRRRPKGLCYSKKSQNKFEVTIWILYTQLHACVVYVYINILYIVIKKASRVGPYSLFRDISMTYMWPLPRLWSCYTASVRSIMHGIVPMRIQLLLYYDWKEYIPDMSDRKGTIRTNMICLGMPIEIRKQNLRHHGNRNEFPYNKSKIASRFLTSHTIKVYNVSFKQTDVTTIVFSANA